MLAYGFDEDEHDCEQRPDNYHVVFSPYKGAYMVFDSNSGSMAEGIPARV